MNEKLKALANLLLEKDLYKEADTVLFLAEEILAHKTAAIEGNSADELAKTAFLLPLLPAAGALWSWLTVGAGAAAAVTTYNLATSDDGNTILSDLTGDFELEEAGPLYLKWYKKLSQSDIIDGHGTFPVGHPMGGAFMRRFIGAKWNAKSKMTEAEFEEAFENYYGESASGIVQFGLDNEGGWVETYNAILALSKGQEAATAAGKDWKTEKPQKEDVGVAKDKETEEGKDSKETKEPQAKLSPKPKRTLGVGSKGSAVTHLQLALLEGGQDLPKYGADGDFGAETKAAVIRFKRMAFINGRYDGKLDEFVNEETLALIESYADGPQKKNPPE